MVRGDGQQASFFCAAEGTRKKGREDDGTIPHDAVGALAQFLGHGVALVDDELLVEDLEDLAPRQVRHGAESRGEPRGDPRARRDNGV